MIQKQKKLFLFSLLIAIGLISIYSFFYTNQRPFPIDRIQFDLPYHQKWEAEPLSQEQQTDIYRLLSQPFSYLGKGTCAYAFASPDGKYVLKFFKICDQQFYWTNRMLSWFRSFYKDQQSKIQRVDDVLNGYKVAYDYEPQKAGLVYIHLNPTIQQHSHVTIIDKEGNTYSVNLDQTRFVIQRRVKPLKNVLIELLNNQNISLATDRICQVFDLYAAHYQQGLYDLGVGILQNNGFIENQAVHFDVSKMTIDATIKDTNYQAKRLKLLANKIDRWLTKHYPIYRDEIMANVNLKIYKLTNS